MWKRPCDAPFGDFSITICPTLSIAPGAVDRLAHVTTSSTLTVIQVLSVVIGPTLILVLIVRPSGLSAVLGLAAWNHGLGFGVFLPCVSRELVAEQSC
jgi:hypothetical protein